MLSQNKTKDSWSYSRAGCSAGDEVQSDAQKFFTRIMYLLGIILCIASIAIVFIGIQATSDYELQLAGPTHHPSSSTQSYTPTLTPESNEQNSNPPSSSDVNGLTESPVNMEAPTQAETTNEPTPFYVTNSPTLLPTVTQPTKNPTRLTGSQTMSPTTAQPTKNPTRLTGSQTASPTTGQPTKSPTRLTDSQTASPTTAQPTKNPTKLPVIQTGSPTTAQPTKNPIRSPTSQTQSPTTAQPTIESIPPAEEPDFCADVGQSDETVRQLLHEHLIIFPSTTSMGLQFTYNNEDFPINCLPKGSFALFQAGLFDLVTGVTIKSKVAKIHEDAFIQTDNSLAAVLILDLSENLLTSLPNGVFRTLANLHDLVLNSNNFVTLNNKILRDSSVVQNIYLGNSKDLIEFPEFIQDAPDLKMLYLTQATSLSVANEEAFIGLTNLKTLVLTSTKTPILKDLGKGQLASSLGLDEAVIVAL